MGEKVSENPYCQSISHSRESILHSNYNRTPWNNRNEVPNLGVRSDCRIKIQGVPLNLIFRYTNFLV